MSTFRITIPNLVFIPLPLVTEDRVFSCPLLKKNKNHFNRMEYENVKIDFISKFLFLLSFWDNLNEKAPQFYIRSEQVRMHTYNFASAQKPSQSQIYKINWPLYTFSTALIMHAYENSSWKFITKQFVRSMRERERWSWWMNEKEMEITRNGLCSVEVVKLQFQH